MSNQLEKVKELIELRAQARLGGGAKAIEKQHDKCPIFRKNVKIVFGTLGRNRIRNNRRPPGLCFCPGFHGICRFLV